MVTKNEQIEKCLKELEKKCKLYQKIPLVCIKETIRRKYLDAYSLICTSHTDQEVEAYHKKLRKIIKDYGVD